MANASTWVANSLYTLGYVGHCLHGDGENAVWKELKCYRILLEEREANAWIRAAGEACMGSGDHELQYIANNRLVTARLSLKITQEGSWRLKS